MFKITSVQEKTRQKELCGIFGVEFHEEFFAYIMFDLDSGDLMGFSQFEVRGSVGYINDLVSAPNVSDNEAMFILGRQTMNFIDLCGAHLCSARIGAGDEKMMSAIGFKTVRDGEYFCDMANMFCGHCDGHTVKID